MTKVYYIACDNGDGSASVRFFKDVKLVEALCASDHYWIEDSMGSFDVPDVGNISFSDDEVEY